MAIAAAVKKSDPQCEPFVGVLIEHHAPRSREDTNWAVKGIRFGRADRGKCSAALAVIVDKMQGAFELRPDQDGRGDDISPPVYASGYFGSLLQRAFARRRLVALADSTRRRGT